MTQPYLVPLVCDWCQLRTVPGSPVPITDDAQVGYGKLCGPCAAIVYPRLFAYLKPAER